MIIKTKDSIEPAIAALETLLRYPEGDARKRKLIEKEINTMRSGAKGEQNCAFYIDSHVKDHPNRVVIHDLRIEVDGEFVQIDHLFLNRLLTFYVLESKSYLNGFKISDRGEFEYWYDNRYHAMPSPIEQAARQARLLEKLLVQRQLMPCWMGNVTFTPQVETYILVDPKTRVIRPDNKDFNTDMVVKADAFMTVYQKDAEPAGLVTIVRGMARTVSKETLIDIANKLVALHQPLVIDYAARFGLSPQPARSIPVPRAAPNEKPPVLAQVSVPSPPPLPQNFPVAEPPACPKCGERMVLRTAKRGDNAGGQFYGCPKYPKCRGIIQTPTTDGTTKPIE